MGDGVNRTNSEWTRRSQENRSSLKWPIESHGAVTQTAKTLVDDWEEARARSVALEWMVKRSSAPRVVRKLCEMRQGGYRNVTRHQHVHIENDMGLQT